MVKFALLARLEAKPGKEQEVADFIRVRYHLLSRKLKLSVGMLYKLAPLPLGSLILLKMRMAETPI